MRNFLPNEGITRREREHTISERQDHPKRGHPSLEYFRWGRI